MNNDFLKRFQKIMLCATEIYSKEVTEIYVQTFFILVKEYEISEIELAFKKHMQTNKFFPTPAEIIESIKKQAELTEKQKKFSESYVFLAIQDQSNVNFE